MNEIVSDQALLKQYKREIENLKKELSDAKNSEGSLGDSSLEDDQLEKKLQLFRDSILNSSTITKVNLNNSCKYLEEKTADLVSSASC